MSKTLIKTSGGEYYAKGRDVFRSPIDNEYDDGSKGTQMGFFVCECSEYIEGAAEIIAAALNAPVEPEPKKNNTVKGF